MKKTKIVATIGPASDSAEMLKKLSESGVNVFRLNMSHGTHDSHGAIIDRIRESKLPGAILMDTKGPEIRTGEVRGSVPLKVGDKITLTVDAGVYEDTGKLGVSYEGFVNDVDVGTNIVLDGGVLVMKVTGKSGKDVQCEVTRGFGDITSRRHINLMGKPVSLPTVTENDWRDIDFGIEKKVDFIALSFVRTAKDVKEVRDYCLKKGHAVQIVAKIENYESTQNLESIIAETDGIMVARGDLACEVPLAEVPMWQRKMIELCSKYNRPVIVATQMLLSMVENIIPTRAETSDVANAVFDGADAVMTSEETTKGKDPVNVISTMSEIALESEKYMASECEKPQEYSGQAVYESLSAAASNMCSDVVGIDALVVISRDTNFTNAAAGYRPNVPVYSFMDNDTMTNQLALTWGVYANTIKFENTLGATLKNAIPLLEKQYGVKRFILLADFANGGVELPTMMVLETKDAGKVL